MGKCKEIKVKVLPANVANAFIKKNHYSGKVVPNSKVHFGAFLNDRLHGVLSFGSSLDKSKIVGLVRNTSWNGFVELNRMAFDEVLPRNSESRVIGICMRMIKKQAPHIDWVISFADACQCGDGTIYRASGFILTAIKENKNIIQLPDGEICHSFNLKPTINTKQYQKYGRNGEGAGAIRRRLGIEALKGFQLRYIYFINKSKREDLTVPEIPFSEIKKRGIGMYKGVGSIDNDAIDIQSNQGGASPTPTLQNNKVANA